MTQSWSRATVSRNHVLAPGLHRITLDVAAEISKAFHAPGQYHRVRVPSGAEAFFAIASPPGAHRLEYLVKANGATASEWARLDAGAVVELSPPEGPGFPLEQARRAALLLVGTGTGFGPLWAVVQAVRKRRDEFEEVDVLYGVDTEPQLAWAEEYEALRGERIVVHPVLDRPHPAWPGRAGRVQAHVAPLAREGQVAFLCGHPSMVTEVTGILGEHGVPADRVFLNTPSL
jgi:NAD(P)H-flavin reductase